MQPITSRRSRGIGLAVATAGTLLASVTGSAAAFVYRSEVPAARAADPAITRAELNSLLGRMNEAVAAAEQERYLACVSLVDPCFAIEQRNWAKDLGRKPPEKFEAVLGEEATVIEGDGAARATLTMKWSMPGGSKRTVTFPARFVRGESGWLYAGEHWHVLDGDRVRILYENEDLKDVAAAVAELLPGIRDHVHEGFGLAEDADLTGRTQQVKLYTKMKHLQQSIYLSYSDSLAGWNEPGEAIKILARNGTGKNTLRTLLAHEYGHVATFQFGPRANDMPWWILEGAAELAAEKYSRGGASTDRRVVLWYQRDGLIEWDRLADFHGEAANHYSHVYTQGHHMIRYISGEFGREARNAWMRAMAAGDSLDDATQKALGLGFDALNDRWLEGLKQAAEAEKPSKDEPAGEKPGDVPAPEPAGKPQR